MHTRDEHRLNETRSRLERMFSERSEPKNQTMPRQPPEISTHSEREPAVENEEDEIDQSLLGSPHRTPVPSR
jgi:hypothetical protein